MFAIAILPPSPYMGTTWARTDRMVKITAKTHRSQVKTDMMFLTFKELARITVVGHERLCSVLIDGFMR
jgi:hypothetical protein